MRVQSKTAHDTFASNGTTTHSSLDTAHESVTSSVDARTTNDIFLVVYFEL